ncbi:UNVERIFIED_CONTAM: hypothetical protein Sradi_4147800 [Sesamum radiatum]|uniref:S-protein homolog n=1 Tax=Sesamum radiatum TaxID=300843 RepID=A0AAW2P5H5_SESRA
MNSITKKHLFSLFLLSIYVSDPFNCIHTVNGVQQNVFPGQGYEVHIVNNLPDNSSPLFVHCASKDDDLGNHTLRLNDDFNWHFRMNIGLTTLYYCRFLWESKNKICDVFNKILALIVKVMMKKKMVTYVFGPSGKMVFGLEIKILLLLLYKYMSGKCEDHIINLSEIE